MKILNESNEIDCELDSEPRMGVDETRDVSRSKDGGLHKTVLREGTGDARPEPGDEVSVHYVGRLASDKTVFDSSVDRGEPFAFKIGEGQVIKGWDEGVATMYKGEKATLVCAPEYAYGANGSPPTIPPNATLEFEVELLSWKSENDLFGDGGVIRVAKLEDGEGWENPKDGDVVTVAYECARKDEATGKMERVEEEKEETFVLDTNRSGKEEEEGELPMGVRMALHFFKKGETQRLLVKNVAKKKYLEEFGSGKENENAQGLYFTTTLKKWSHVEKICGGLASKMTLENAPGDNYETPNEGAKVVFSSVKVYKGKHDFSRRSTDDASADLVYETTEDYSFEIGGEDNSVIAEGCEEGIQRIKIDETAQIVLPPELAFGESGETFESTKKNIPANSFVTYVLTLKSMERAKDPWTMTGEEKAECAEKLKLAGNSFFKNKDYAKASAKYSQGLRLVEPDAQQGDETAKKIKALKLSLSLNFAACALKQKSWKQAISSCEDALKIEGLNDKALYRKASAEIEFELYDEAKRTLKTLFEEVDEKHVEATKLRQRLKQKEAVQRKKDSKVFGGMFSKLDFFTEEERNKKPKSDEEKILEAEKALGGLGGALGGAGNIGADDTDGDTDREATVKDPVPLEDLEEDYGAKAAATETFPFEEQKQKLKDGEKMSLETA